MQFSVPQFIDIEDKIFGPLTLKQFIYMVGGVGASFVFWSFLPKVIAVVFIVPIAALAFLLAFKPVSGRPFVVVLEAAFKYTFGSKLFLWKKERNKETKTVTTTLKKTGVSQAPSIPKVIEGKLDDMALSLDMKKKQNG